MYTITAYTREIANEYGVEVAPSDRKGKKIKVTDGDRVFHLGDISRLDFATMLVRCENGEMSIEEANERQKRFYKRFFKAAQEYRSGAYWVSKLLWLL